MAHTTDPKSNVISFDPHQAFATRPLWAHATRSREPGQIVCTAGQVGCDQNLVTPDNIDDEIALAFSNLQQCLSAAGATVKDILKLTYYIVDFDPDNRPHSKHLANFLAGHRPTTTLVPVTKLANPKWHFEVEAIASIPQARPRYVDVVIVGAGLSGLSAAREVSEAGLTYAIAEARDRVGGKTWSVSPTGDGRTVDLGAAWINDTTQAEVYRLAQSLGLKLVEQNTEGDVVMEDTNGDIGRFQYGSLPEKLSEPGAVQAMAALRDHVHETSLRIGRIGVSSDSDELSKMTFEQWLMKSGATPTGIASAAVWTRAMLGLELSEVSALFFLRYCAGGGGLNTMRSDKKDGGQYLRFAKGTQQLSLGLASHLAPTSILLNSPVYSITQDPTSTLVRTARGDLLCKRVIVTIPTPLYHTITFSPPLSPSKTHLSSSTRLGYTNKVLIIYASPWWRASGLCGLAQSLRSDAITVTRDSSVDEDGQYSLTCFTVGQPGRELAKLPQRERFERVLEHVGKLFGPYYRAGGQGKEVSKPLAISEHVWWGDQWAQGCPCPVMPAGVGGEEMEKALRSVEGRLHFAGTETAWVWKGYMEGAISSGKRAAAEVLGLLTQPKL